jgi:hypothetical protein
MTAILQFPVRALAFAIGSCFYFMETAADWLIGIPNKTEYVRIGSCKRCGRCCRFLALEMPPFIARRNFLVHLISRLHGVFLNFKYEGRDDRLLVYHCGYFVGDASPFEEEKRPFSTPRCRIYHFRHRLCRFYPRQRLYGHPKTHPDCGFKFVRRDGKPTFDEVLAEKRGTL